MKRSHNILIGISCIFLLASVGCGDMVGPHVQGSGVAKTEPRGVGAFKNIRLDGAAKINVQIGNDRSVTVTADDNVLPLIETDVHGDTLVISSKENYSTRIGVTVTITTPDLAGIELNGSGDVNVKDLKGGRFSTIIRGSGNVSADGTVDEVNAEIKGSGDVKLADLQAKRGEVSVAGSGNVTVNVTDELQASIAGSGDVRYKGSPKVQKSVAGSGSVKQVG